MTRLRSSSSRSLLYSSCSSGFIPLLFAFVVAGLQTRSFLFASVVAGLQSRSFLFALVVQPFLPARGGGAVLFLFVRSANTSP